MKSLNKMLGHLDNAEVELLSHESQSKLVQSIEVLLFNYDNWYRNRIDTFQDTSFSERLELFIVWNDQCRNNKTA